MSDVPVEKIERALKRSWSADTSYCFSPTAHPAYGQCAQTAIVIHAHFGGEILRTDGWPPKGRHFYNRINGKRYDFTSGQFEMADYSHKVEYKDIPSNPREAATEALPAQIEAMRNAFQKALEDEAG